MTYTILGHNILKLIFKLPILVNGMSDPRANTTPLNCPPPVHLVSATCSIPAKGNAAELLNAPFTPAHCTDRTVYSPVGGHWSAVPAMCHSLNAALWQFPRNYGIIHEEIQGDGVETHRATTIATAHGIFSKHLYLSVLLWTVFSQTKTNSNTTSKFKLSDIWIFFLLSLL